MPAQQLQVRFIPTPVGNAEACADRRTPRAVHPHARGERCTGVFWRAGRCFTEQPREIALADLSADDEAAIRAERQLIVTDIGDDTPGA